MRARLKCCSRCLGKSEIAFRDLESERAGVAVPTSVPAGRPNQCFTVPGFRRARGFLPPVSNFIRLTPASHVSG